MPSYVRLARVSGGVWEKPHAVLRLLGPSIPNHSWNEVLERPLNAAAEAVQARQH